MIPILFFNWKYEIFEFYVYDFICVINAVGWSGFEGVLDGSTGVSTVSWDSFKASHHVWNSAKIWYAINKKENKTSADNSMFTNTLLAFLKWSPVPPSVIYRYHATITIITIITQYIYQNTFATLMIKSE